MRDTQCITVTCVRACVRFALSLSYSSRGERVRDDGDGDDDDDDDDDDDGASYTINRRFVLCQGDSLYEYAALLTGNRLR